MSPGPGASPEQPAPARVTERPGMARFLKSSGRPYPCRTIREADMGLAKTNHLRILILLSLALGFFLGRKTSVPRSSDAE